MELLLGLVETVVGFAAVMLAASLLVMVAIRALHFMANRRATGLAELLGTIHRDFRRVADPVGQPGDLQELTFVSDVLTHPALIAESAPNGSLSLAKRAADKVDSITQEELLLIVESFAVSGALPERWFFMPTASGRSLFKYKLHVETWFKTVATRSRRKFALESQKLSWLFSTIIVAAINLDAFELALAVHRSADGRSALQSAVPGLLDMADRLAPPGDTADGLEADRDALIQGIGSDVGQLNSLFNIPELELGWTHSRIVRSIQAYRGGLRAPPSGTTTPQKVVPQRGGLWPPLSDPADPGSYRPKPPTPIGLTTLLLEFLRWLAAIGISVFLVAQGPPFWADLIRSILTRTSARVPRND